MWQFPRPRFRSDRRAPRRSLTLAVVAVVVGPMVLFGCGSDEGGAPTLTWYINPDNGGQAELAKKCGDASDGAYRVETQILPNEADQQREQLVRRLAADDPSIDLMSLDPPFVAEFANAGYLLPITNQADVKAFTDGVLEASAHHRLLGRPAGGSPVLGQHPAALVSQVGRQGGGSGSHRRGLHVGPDDQSC